MRILELAKMQLDFKKEIQKIFNLEKNKNTIMNSRKLKIGTLLLLVLPIFSQKQIFSDTSISRFQVKTKNISWEKANLGEKNEKDIIWQKIKNNNDSKIEIKEIMAIPKIENMQLYILIKAIFPEEKILPQKDDFSGVYDESISA